MCGIAGLARKDSLRTGDSAAVRKVLAAETHRGPDGEGFYEDARVVLGHRRLAIIDLSTDGLQPMANEDGSLRVTFNGEIYNYKSLQAELLAHGHRFHSRSDTEVLLHGYEEWGIEGLLARLRGMFAFALHDPQRGLIIARDRLGIKPLYYHSTRELLVFASEVKALMRAGLVPEGQDRQALTGFLMTGAIPQPKTIVKAVSCLPPGHWAEWADGALRVHKYWDLPTAGSADSEVTPDSLGPLLEDVVRGHLISDVPLGIFLSGGVDSAGLVALASRIRNPDEDPLITLTVIFNERQFSEAAAAAGVAKHFGTAHREIRVTGKDFKNELPGFFRSMDQPTNDGINSYFVSKAAHDAGLKVVLSGLGGDEVFWGYKHYRWLSDNQWATQIPGRVRGLMATAGYRYGKFSGRDNFMRTAWLKPAGGSERVYLTMRGFFAPDQVARLMDLNQKEVDDAVGEHFGSLGAAADASASSINYLEIKRYLHDQLLRDTDVFSMAHSVEARVPFLDHLLVERLWNAAPGLKLDKQINKPLLVRAINDSEVSVAGARPKQGFTFPMAAWMKSCAPELSEMAETAELGRADVKKCWTDFAEGRMHWSRAWALTVLGATTS